MSMAKTALTHASHSSKIASSTATRSISIGTDMISTVVSLQKARSWHMTAAEGSNLAADNAVSLKDLFQDRTVAVFGVPAPFTGTCSNEHYPGYKQLAVELKQAGIDEIVCLSVSDPYALAGWQQALKNNNEHITFLADPKAEFAVGYGVDSLYDECSLGLRSKRFSMIVVNGFVHTFRLVEDAVTDAAQVLAEIKEIKENPGVVTVDSA
jgi:peroxiredoxin